MGRRSILKDQLVISKGYCWKFLAMIALLVLTPGSAFAGSSGIGKQQVLDPLRIPFTVDETGLPTFVASIDGKPISLFLDFGSSKTLAIKQSVLKKLSVSYGDAAGHFTSWTGLVSKVKPFTAHNFSAGTIRRSTIDGTSLPDHLYNFPQDGSLGFGFLRNFLVVFDYAHGEVRLYPPNNPVALQKECGAGTYAINDRIGVAEVSAETELGTRIFLLDTGANRDVARPGGNPVLGKPGTLFEFKKFQLGGHDLGKHSFLLVPYAAPDVDGVLGRDFFSKHVVCIDIDAGKMGVK
jgi:hypothetical protein